MQFHLANILVFFVLGFFFVGAMLGIGKLLRPHNPNPAKLGTYECGEPPTGSAWINFNIRFYLIALVFLIFDVELAFMYPVVAVYREWVVRGQGLYALFEIVLFMGILCLGLAYVWVKRDLEWVKRVPEDELKQPAARPARAA
jgi:NADH-quinone oxidoreductase subunit A